MSDLVFRRACPIPIGGVLILTSYAEAPTTLYPGTTWGKACQGRCMAGSGTNMANSGTYANSYGSFAASSVTWSVGQRHGEISHLLSAAESGVSSHNHGLHSGHTWIWGGASGSGTLVQARGAVAEAVSAVTSNQLCTIQGVWNVTENVTERAASSAHNNLPPVEVFDIWYRTS